TGFLMPDAGISERNGFEFSLPFFWAARENVNVTLTPEYLTKRGFKPAVEVEYVFAERGAGTLYGTVRHDRDVDRHDPDAPISPNRGGTSFEHQMDLPARSWLAVDGNLVSDNEIPFDFDDFDEYRSDRFLHSRGLAATRFGPSQAFGLEGAVRLADDLSNPNDQDRDKLLLQRLPQLTWSATPGERPFLRGLGASADLDYVHSYSYEDPNQAARALLVGDFFYDVGADGIANCKERNAAGQSLAGPCELPQPMPPPADIHNDNN